MQLKKNNKENDINIWVEEWRSENFFKKNYIDNLK
jgi:hypothetical protein